MTTPHRLVFPLGSADDFEDPAGYDASVAGNLLLGKVLTRRLTAWEVERDALRTDTDLVLLEPLLSADVLYTADADRMGRGLRPLRGDLGHRRH